MRLSRTVTTQFLVVSLLVGTLLLLRAEGASAHGNCYLSIGVPVRITNPAGEPGIYFHATYWCSYKHEFINIHVQPQKLVGDSWVCYPFCWDSWEENRNAKKVEITVYRACTRGYFRLRVNQARTPQFEHADAGFGPPSNLITCD